MAKRKAVRRKTSSARKGPDRTSGGGKDRPKKVSSKRYPARSSSAREAKRDQELVRLNKYLADCGVASRRACDELIAKGKVTIDDLPVTELGVKVDPSTQVIEVAGYVLRPANAARRYYLLNKPTGVVCTNEVRETRPRAIDLITDRDKGRIYTIGRLDEDSSGLILLTNDGEFAQRVAHPRHGVPKTYQVRVQGRIPDEALAKIRGGTHLAEGKTGGARILVRRRTVKSSTLTVTLREGKNREVRRVFARAGYKVISLERTDIGPITTRGLKTGKWRALSREEVEALLNMLDGEGEGEAEEIKRAPAKKKTGGRPRSTLAKKPGGPRKTGSSKTGSGKKSGSKKKAGRKKPADRGKPTRGNKKPAAAKDADAAPKRRIVGPK